MERVYDVCFWEIEKVLKRFDKCVELLMERIGL